VSDRPLVERPLPGRTEVVIVGAGLAGMAAARVLQHADRHVVVLEAADEVGGRVRTDIVEGFRLDRGFQVLLTGYPEIGTQFDVKALDLRPFDPGALVWDGTRFNTVGDPFRQPSTLPASIVARIGTPLDKLRIVRLRRRLLAADPVALFREPDRTVQQALEAAGFSASMINTFFRPLFGGIQLDPTLASSSRFFEVLFRTLAIGDSAVPALGMGELSRQFAAPLRDCIWLNTPVGSIIDNKITTVDGRTIEADRVVVATDGPAAATLVGIPAVASRPVTSVWFAADRAPTSSKMIVLNGSGTGQALNVAVMTNVASDYGPPGRTLIVASCPGVFDHMVEPTVRSELRAWWGTMVDGWHHLRTDAIAHGQPDHVPPTSPKQRVYLGGNLFICGDHRDTGSIQGALFSGRRCGEAVLQSFGAQGARP
jgi:phytoene dehydrogenase-like protein